MIELTPLDVRNKRGDFRKGIRGYEPHEVDGFLEVVAERLEAVVRENLAMRDRLAELQGRVERAEGREQAVQEALVSAQAMGDEIRGRADRDAELRRREAEQEAQELLARARQSVETLEGEARALLERTRRELDDLHRSRNRFLRSYRSLLERELDLVATEEGRDPEPQVDLDALRIFSRRGGDEGKNVRAELEDPLDSLGLPPLGEGPDSEPEGGGTGEGPTAGNS